MRHSLPIAPQFYVTAPQPCPYLPGQSERKLFTSLSGEGAKALNDTLSKQGFRRSQNVLYRPACSDCAACLSARIRVADHEPSRSHRKVLRRNGHLLREATSPWASEEQYDLFRRYLDARHADGGMADMDVFEFAAMIEETPIRSRVIEYTESTTPAATEPATDSAAKRGTGRGARRLVAVCLTDVLDDGLSLVYSFYDPAYASDSLGTYMILDHIALARQVGLPYVYLGYWVPGSTKMDYKARFGALEVYREGAWRELGDPAEYSGTPHPLAVRPITEQVAAITLPPTSPSAIPQR
ncbi:arginyltransferase [Pararhodobacter sp.]|uniref:arginyltransferase n=1 Tax=Pararhodobacter sp. TaxID=2127056 RepID=UPI002FDD71D9